MIQNSDEQNVEKKATPLTGMENTMEEIEMQDGPQVNKQEDLKSEISTLEKDIASAEEEAVSSEAGPYNHTPVSPEQANQRQRDIFFMRRNRDKKQSEYDDIQKDQ